MATNHSLFPMLPPHFQLHFIPVTTSPNLSKFPNFKVGRTSTTPKFSKLNLFLVHPKSVLTYAATLLKPNFYILNFSPIKFISHYKLPMQKFTTGERQQDSKKFSKKKFQKIPTAHKSKKKKTTTYENVNCIHGVYISEY